MAQAFVQWYATTSRSKPRQSCEVSLPLAMTDELCGQMCGQLVQCFELWAQKRAANLQLPSSRSAATTNRRGTWDSFCARANRKLKLPYPTDETATEKSDSSDDGPRLPSRLDCERSLASVVAALLTSHPRNGSWWGIAHARAFGATCTTPARLRMDKLSC